MLVIESGTAEIDEPNIGPFDSSKVSLLFRIVGDVEIGINEEDVLRFQVRMGQFIVMKESHSVGELVTDMSDLLQRVRLVIVIFQKVENGKSKHFEGNAHMAVVVEPIQHLDTQELSIGILPIEFLEDVDFQFGRFTILLHVFYDLESETVVPGFNHISDFDNFTEGSFA